ncbi:acyltransferase family protein [Streptomyces sp. DSM 44917]|uniref:Acyltransferase family protein n=1 Tax=Streptomyces boetiae TaxID=3075541 RepID=A0ABU2L7Q9_9ACTN|nr:acyltransferase family protein [Streptomyces sp. DSM 44917]MDT0307592.1 acyltransferase family protein [Streptomyces sp. DSM 44917]
MLHVRNERAPLPAARATAADPPPAVTDGSARETWRDPFFDNAKYLAIVLVAVGHAWTPLRDDSRAASALYLFVYAFHMPAFIMIAGYFSRGFTGRPEQLKRLITGIGVPYLIFEVAYVLFRQWGTGAPAYPFSVLDPYYVTWFLIALFVWRLTAPIWHIVRRPLPVALAIAALASVSPHLGDDLNIQRVLQFLPFFVLGLHLRREHFRRLRDPRVRAASVPVLLGALAVAYWAVPRMNHAWFYRTDSAQELGAPGWAGVVMGLALFGCGLLLTACFLAWVPTGRRWFTALGAGTIYGYLLHGFLAKASRWWDWYAADWVNTPGGRVVVTAIGAVAVTLLCTAPVRRAFRAVVEPTMDWAFRPEAVRPAVRT